MASNAECRAVHKRLRAERGSASDHACIDCGTKGVRLHDWAYQYTAIDEKTTETGRPYSTELSDYAPMCRSCHFRFDQRMEPEILEARRKSFREGNGFQGPRSEEHTRKITESRAASIKADPELAERMRREQSAACARANARRRRCIDCGVVYRPASMGNHLKHSGHVGFVDVD